MASLGEELLNVVNRLQDLVFNTIGNDSLDLPQIVCLPHIDTPSRRKTQHSHQHETDLNRSS